MRELASMGRRMAKKRHTADRIIGLLRQAGLAQPAWVTIRLSQSMAPDWQIRRFYRSHFYNLDVEINQAAH